MKPVVAYRHKLRWKLWRVWQALRLATGRGASLVVLGFFVAAVAAGTMAITLGWQFLPPYQYEDGVGRVVATGPVRATRGSQPIALVRIGSDVVRFEGSSLAGCQIGHYIDVRRTFTTRNRRRRQPWLLRTEPMSSCRELP